MSNITLFNTKVFDSIKHIDRFGNEYWEARELQKVLGYREWRNFNNVIYKAKNICDRANNDVNKHFVEYKKLVKVGSNGGTQAVIDYKLSKYACSLICQKGNFKKEEVIYGQKYFTFLEDSKDERK